MSSTSRIPGKRFRRGVDGKERAGSKEVKTTGKRFVQKEQEYEDFQTQAEF